MECNLHHRRPARRARRGFSFLETLVATMIFGVCLATLTSSWSVGYNLSIETDQLSLAYNLSRHAMEEVKQSGFSSTPEGTTVLYYDSQGGSESSTQAPNHVESVTIVVSSDQIVNGSSPVQPAPGALRTVTVTVKLLSAAQTLYQDTTYLARAGV